ncbi:MAG: indolepyruvate oxidoreductase subunit beta [Chloroflexi bacterium]|nr:indolepyruvate oxidoreductase subunit beta [Chloroflexota bacterium]
MNFLLAGVGGQGTLLASNVVARVGVRAGFDVKKAEVHGMAQRGGSVSSHLRWGEKVFSPLIGRGEVDYLVALERLEALRYIDMVRPDAMVIVGEMRILPLSVSSGTDVYPDDDVVRGVVERATGNLILIPSLSLAEGVGNIRAHNIVVLGALSRCVPQVSPDIWLQVIAESVPERFVEVNQRAFEVGREAIGAPAPSQ